MKFRTEIDIPPRQGLIQHDQGIVMLGSCFTDNIGERLAQDGFDVTHNPFGPLYNPASIHRLMHLSVHADHSEPLRLVQDAAGAWHCLDFASRYVNADADALTQQIHAELNNLHGKLESARTIIITLGTAYVFALKSAGSIVGNCHKFPAKDFDRFRLSVEAAKNYLMEIEQMLPSSIQNRLVTISPIRHVADGLHGNQVSKAVLQLAVDEAINASGGWRYFPAYEIVMDDLRDYRYYAADMKHPSEVAIDYIYEQFRRAYFDAPTQARADECHRQWLRSQHRPIIRD